MSTLNFGFEVALAAVPGSGLDVKSGKFLIIERPGPDGLPQIGDFVNNVLAPLAVNLEFDEEQDGGTVPKFHFLTGLKCLHPLLVRGPW